MNAPTQPFPLQPISEEGLAAFVSLLGPQVIRVGDILWGKVRLGFFRPLLTMRPYDPSQIRLPLLSRLGGAQYAVKHEAEANSCLNMLLFKGSQDYTLESLDKKRRRQVKLAGQEFELRIMSDREAFKQQAHPVYLSFHNRTGYKVGEQRREPAQFAAWTDQLFQIPHVLILGAYRDGKLGGISLSYLIEDTVIYATFFCDDKSLALYLSDLMLHTVRLSAAAHPAARQVFAGMFKGIRGLDDFYLLRGAQLVRVPARLEINPLARFGLKKFRPKHYAQLLGELTAEQLSHAGMLPGGKQSIGVKP